MNGFNIGSRRISEDSPVFIVAELSANHNQSFELAVRSIEAIAKSGADAVKIQTYTADTLTIDVRSDYFKMSHGTIWDGKYFYDLYKEAYMPWEWQPKLKLLAEEMGLIFFSSPFDPGAVDFLEEMNVPAYKVASYEITDIPLIEYIASKAKPVLISTGIATMDDISEAVAACLRMNNDRIALLKCTSSYPAPPEEINLRTIQGLKEKFGLIIGLSDHTTGYSIASAGAALGAKIIEKHFILDRDLGGPDATFSMEPDEFRRMVEAIREIEKALGSGTYQLTDKMGINRNYARSLFAVKDIAEGEEFSSDNIRSIRPGYGLAPKYLKEIIGKKCRKKIEKGTPLSWDLIS